MFRWCSGGVQVVFRWCSGGVQVVFRWCSGGVQVVFRWCSGGVQVVFRWCSGGVQVVFRWCSGGVQVFRCLGKKKRGKKKLNEKSVPKSTVFPGGEGGQMGRLHPPVNAQVKTVKICHALAVSKLANFRELSPWLL